MLLNIHVKNFALIDEADIEFDEGLNILTGETGAGKSILIDSVMAALGNRCRSDVVGKNSDSAFVSLTFSIDNNYTKQKIEALDISTEYNSIIISRKITKDRSVFKINDEPASAAKVKELSALLIDIHGQRDQESLIKDATQLEIIDRFGGLEHIVSSCKTAFENYSTSLNNLNIFNKSSDELAREIDYIRYEIDEIKNANLKEGEREELEDRYNIIKHSKTIVSSVGEALSFLENGQENASEYLMKAFKAIEYASNIDEKLKNISSQISDALEITSDAIRELNAYYESIDFKEHELINIENRIDELNRIEKKYGSNIDAVLKTLDEKIAKLESLENYDISKTEAETQAKKSHEEYIKIASRLSDERKKAAKVLQTSIIDALSNLNFLDIQFDFDFHPSGESALGIDSVRYLISTNPGESLRPLSDVASGGELSRIMLGFRSVLSKNENVSSLIFDEIDTGVSGKTAGLVANKLKEISKAHQVLCITHLPQIAAMAHSHFAIEKCFDGERTRTNIRLLDANSEIDEIARLLGGTTVTEASYINAKELKRLAKGV